MIDQVTQHRRVMLGVRAPRVAVLLNSSATWGECLVLVEILTGIWGGATFALIPTDGQVISPLFWRLLKLHDPDWFALFPWSKVSPQLELQLTRHATMDGPKQMIHRLGLDIGHPLTPTHEALRAWRPASPGAVNAVSVDGDDLSRLLVLSTAGALNDLMRAELGRLSVEVQQVTLVIGAPAGVYATTNELWAPFTRHSLATYPISLSLLRLGVFGDVLGPRNHPAVAVCGATIEDFSLFWMLRVLRGSPLNSNVYWLPLDMHGLDRQAPGLQYWQRAAMEQTLGANYRDHRLILTSATIPLSELAPLSEAIQLPAAVVEADDLETLAPYVATFWEAENTPNVNQTIVQFAAGQAMAITDTPAPAGLRVDHETRVRWTVEGSIEEVRPPTRPEMTPLVIGPEQGLSGYRVAREGFAFSGLSDAIFYGTATRSLLVRPRLRLPADWQVLEALARAAHLTITPSDKGTYEQQLIRFLGGTLERTAALLRHPRVSALLTTFADMPNQPLSAREVGIKLRKIRYLDLSAMAAVLDRDHEEAVAFANTFLGVGLLHRGLLMKCKLCRYFDWYRMAEVDDSITCHRCNRQQVYPAETSGAFRLDEIARLALSNRSDVALLGADWLRRGARNGFRFTTGIEIRRAEDQPATDLPWLEADVLAVQDGAVCVGEGKSGGSLGSKDRRQLGRYLGVCRRLRPDWFLAITDQEEWTPAGTAILAELGGSLRPLGVEVLSLTRAALMNDGDPLPPDTVS